MLKNSLSLFPSTLHSQIINKDLREDLHEFTFFFADFVEPINVDDDKICKV